MHYLEDYLEVVQFFPGELKSRLLQIRELDERVQGQLESLEDRSRTFFTLSRKNKADWREQQFHRLRDEYDRVLAMSEEKVHIAEQIQELLERYMKHLDHDLNHFTLELEADTAGITEMLEQKSYQLDRPPSPERPPITQRKRHHAHHEDLLDPDDYSPSPSSRASPIHTRTIQYSRRERRPTLSSLGFSLEPDPDIFDFGDDLASTTADLYAGSGGKPSLSLLSVPDRTRKKAHILSDPLQDDMTYIDPNEPRYCLCNQVSYGEMICCDNPNCAIEWFHYGCVGITEAPKGKWYCPQCIAQMKKKSRK